TFATGQYNLNQAVALADKLGMRSPLTGDAYGWQGIKNILLNPLYAGFIQSSFTDGAYIKAIHKPLIQPVIHYRIKAVIDGKDSRQTRQAKDEWPLRGGFLKCFFCKHPLSGSSPKGRSRHYPRYACPKCRVS